MSAPILVLVADLRTDLSPLTQHLWARRIAHRVSEDATQQFLWVGTHDDAQLAKALVDAWQAGTLTAPPKPPSIHRKALLANSLATSVSLSVLLLVIAVFVWMQISPKWQIWMISGQEFWPQARLDWHSYVEMGWWSLWRPTLLHFSLMHLVFNGLWWWVLARRIERLDGTWVLLLLLLLCGMAGNMVQWWYAGPAFGGLSGVTLGLSAWVGVRFKRAPYDVPKFLLPVMVGWIVLTIGADTLMPGFSGVAHGAHIGGLLMGGLLGFLWPIKRSKTFKK